MVVEFRDGDFKNVDATSTRGVIQNIISNVAERSNRQLESLKRVQILRKNLRCWREGRLRVRG